MDDEKNPFWVVAVFSALMVFWWASSREAAPLFLAAVVWGCGIFIYDGVKRKLLIGGFALAVFVWVQSGFIGW